MDFFAAQDEARKNTTGLLWLFLLCVLGVVIAVSLLSWGVGILMGYSALPIETLALVAVGTAALIFLASGFKSAQLRGGGGVVARDLGGRLLDPSTTETSERKLLNVVEEMAIASGVPVPQVYVMDEEEGINAFAAGTEPGNAAIGVTRGCMMRLSRAELQGVIAHEFSHILNGDMKMNMRLIGWIFGLIVLSILGRGLFESLRFMRVGGRSRENNGGAIILAILAVGLGLIIIGGVGVFFARILQAAVSRQREFLADASAVQFTREPDGLAGALQKIGGKGSKMETSKASEASHCFFADGGLFAFGLATHPPLELRIKRILKGWDGQFSESEIAPIASDGGDARVAGLAGSTIKQASGGKGRFGDSADIDLAKGARIWGEIPQDWQRAVHDREKAQALVFGLLLAQDQDLRAKEMDFLTKEAGESAAELARSWQQKLGESHSARKIALIDLAVPTLRNLSREEYGRFLGITRKLIASDEEVDLFEFMLQRLIEHHLEDHFTQRGPRRIRHRDLSGLRMDAALLISAFANLNPEPGKAFAAGKKDLDGIGDLIPPQKITLHEIGASLEKFELAAPPVKRQVLEACGRAIASDGVLSSREAELLRAMADSIGCAIPPLDVAQVSGS